jgi:hypothetical protein
MSTQTFATIRSARTEGEAALLISILRQAGLHPWTLAPPAISYSPARTLTTPFRCRERKQQRRETF